MPPRIRCLLPGTTSHLARAAPASPLRQPLTRGFPVAHKLARSLSLGTLAVLTFGLFGGFLPTSPSICNCVRAYSPPAAVERTVFLGSGLADECTIVLTAAVAAAERPGIVLFDSLRLTDTTKAF